MKIDKYLAYKIAGSGFKLLEVVTGKVHDITGATNYRIKTYEGDSVYFNQIGTDYKVISRTMYLTKPITVQGKEVVPLAEMYNISKGNFMPLYYKYIDPMSTDKICIDQGCQRLIYFQIYKCENDVRLNNGYGFKLFTTDLRNDNKINQEVNNQNLIFDWLEKHHFCYFLPKDMIVENDEVYNN